MEIWKHIPGLENIYCASNLGRIKSIERKIEILGSVTKKIFTRKIKECILSPANHTSGYLFVNLDRKHMGKPVHQLVALAFMGEPKQNQEVLHTNGDKQDNRIENLRYGTREENMHDIYFQGGKAGCGKLTLNEVNEIRDKLNNGITGNCLASEYFVSASTISRIKRKESFSWLPEGVVF